MSGNDPIVRCSAAGTCRLPIFLLPAHVPPGPTNLQATDCTHRWTVYVRGPNNEDLSYIIKKVNSGGEG
jgi:transcription initiation factor IIF auxiliary subunit